MWQIKALLGRDILSKDVPGVGKPGACSFEQKAEGAGVHGQKMCKFRTGVCVGGHVAGAEKGRRRQSHRDNQELRPHGDS